jgi:hypothetical protein
MRGITPRGRTAHAENGTTRPYRRSSYGNERFMMIKIGKRNQVADLLSIAETEYKNQDEKQKGFSHNAVVNWGGKICHIYQKLIIVIIAAITRYGISV